MRPVDPARSRVVLIGTATYTYRGPDGGQPLPDLPAVANNLSDLYAFLTDPELGGFPAENCAVARDGATLRDIAALLRDASKAAADLLLVYYAGHGLIGQRQGLFLGLTGTEKDLLKATALDFDDVRAACLDSPARNRVVIIDSCFSGRAIGPGMAGAQDELRGQLDVEGTYVLTSAARHAIALSLDGERHTAFTGRLLELFRDGTPNAGAYLSLDDIYREMQRRLNAEGLPLPNRSETDRIDMLGLIPNRGSLQPVAPTDGLDVDEEQAAPLDEESEALRSRLRDANEIAKTGRHAEAAQMIRDLIPDMERRWGRTHRDTLIARRHLAFQVGESGDSAEAKRLFAELLAVAELPKAFGPEHQETLAIRRHLAFYKAATGSRSQATRDLRTLIPLMERHLGSTHRETLTTRRQLAEFIGENGNRAEAVRRLRDLLTDAASVYEAGDAELFTIRELLARNIGEGPDGSPAKAADLLESLVKDTEQLSEADDIKTLTARRLLAYYRDRAALDSTR